MLRPLLMLLPPTFLVLAACGSETNPAGADGALTVTSPAFEADNGLPVDFTCDDVGTSPPLAWSGVPPDATNLALVVSDPDAPGGTFIHWIVTDIDPSTSAVAEGELPGSGMEVANDGGGTSYEPACPPDGSHRYQFTVYALSRSVSLSDEESATSAVDAIEDAATTRGSLTATYERQ